MTLPPPPFPPGPAVPVLAPPPRKRRTWLIVLVSVALVFAAGCAFGIIRLVLGVKHVSDVESDVNEATSAFIEDSRDGLSQQGWDGLCEDARGNYAQEDLAGRKQELSGYSITGTDVDWARGQATVRVELRREDGTRGQEVYVVEEEGERWKVCAFPA
ncbi:Rv0361 family membrane protein [Winogradskya consettensis]|uniref:Rv0361 family membrane protein n=1 Tax=Winogradskya consettensis TaxID=113560 RepID=UPI001BB32A68|nr:hypothetical protein [Actinoplanes consettensis]